jgi:hypothetical protein
MLKIILCKFTDAWVDISLADPDPGSGVFLTLGSGSGMGKKSGFRSGIYNPDHIYKSLETIFGVTILKFIYVNPESGIREGKNPHPGSATLVDMML